MRPAAPSVSVLPAGRRSGCVALRRLTYAGSATVVFALGLFHAGVIGGYGFTGSRFVWSVAYVGALGIACYGLGIPELVRRQEVVVAAVAAPLAATLAISVAQLLLGVAVLPRLVVLLTPPLLAPWYASCSALCRRRGDMGTRLVAVLSEDESASLRSDVAASPENVAHVAAVLAPEKASSCEVGSGPLVRAACEARASVLVLNRAALEDDRILDQVAELHALGVRVRTLGRFYDEWLGKLPRHEVERASLLFDVGELHRAAYTRLKRLTDMAVGLAGIPVLAVLTPVVALANLFGNRGPLLYRQPRVGRNGRVFTIYKFRTMRPGPVMGAWTAEGDERVTKVGRWLRRTHLDELPQLVNILRGDLTTVGPRPEQPHYVADLSSTVPFYTVRHLVRPGLTGWAQVNYPYGSSGLDALEKLRYDLYYLRHQSLVFDLRILARSLRNVVWGTGR